MITSSEDNQNELGKSTRSGSRIDVTLVDAFKIKDLNLLIVSYLIRECHNWLIQLTPFY